MSIFNNLQKIKVNKKSKKAVEKWGQVENRYIDINNININKYNVGLLTGYINNIIVLDIDIKADGLKEFNKYVSEFGEPRTIKQKTPSGGYHFFF
jgi:hypothetical protein